MEREAPAPPSHLLELVQSPENSVTVGSVPKRLPRETGEDIGMGSPVPLSQEAVQVITNLRNMKVSLERNSRILLISQALGWRWGLESMAGYCFQSKGETKTQSHCHQASSSTKSKETWWEGGGHTRTSWRFDKHSEAKPRDTRG